MATVAEFRAPANSFPFGAVFQAVPAGRVELERVVYSEEAVPYVWVSESREGDGPVDLTDAVGDHPAVTSVVCVDRTEGQSLWRVHWSRDADGLMAAVQDSGVTLLSAVAVGGEWTFHVRADDREAMAAFRRRCLDAGVDLAVQSIQALPRTGAGTDDLTPSQREALLLAYERGFFEVPGRVTLTALAEELGISRQALSSRLRRGYRVLVRRTLVE